MADLKTLKDLFPDSIQITRGVVRDLRQEIIKWIKELESIDAFCLNCNKSLKDGEIYDHVTEYHTVIERGYEDSDIPGAILFAKHFFNIEEKDLK